MTALKIILLVFAFLLLIYAIFSLILKFKKKHDIKKKQQNDSYFSSHDERSSPRDEKTDVSSHDELSSPRDDTMESIVNKADVE